ncbi:hypothetical protein CP532_1068 [Ophiocordyceps camponoti-leonardi (nom. inval.)]|nr:hypothetical protein CP532_1068 [Ophiocordyceps camponoti-leonardi (nom. inval.)]
MADQWMEAYRQLPPVSRTMATAVLVSSVGVYTSLLSGYWFVFHPQFLWRFPPQIWRFITAFLLTGPELSILFDTYFVYSYLSQLEAGNPRFSRKQDLLWYLTFVGGAIMFLSRIAPSHLLICPDSVFSTAITVPGKEEDHPCTAGWPIIRNPGWSVVQMMNYLSGMGYGTFLRALILAMCYTVTQDQRGMKASLMFITIPAPMTPYAMLAFNLLFPSGVSNMLLQLLGLLAAHLFDFLTRIWPEYGGGRNLIPTPAFYSTAVQSVEARWGVPSPAAGGGSRGPLPDSWRTRGTGHRLG